MVLRVDEVYESVQGEGPRVGEPTVFVRFGGCNLKCPGWPCDTQHAIDVKYRDEWLKQDIPTVTQRVVDAAGEGTTNICFTGGEPFLQKHTELYDLVRSLQKVGFHVFECFSNGTREYPDWTHEYIHFIMDWKLPGSGEDCANLMRLQNLEHLCEGDAVKFVIKDHDDFTTAVDLWDEYLQKRPDLEVYYGVAWGHLENQELVSWVLEEGLPWRLNVQVHNHIWDRSLRGI